LRNLLGREKLDGLRFLDIGSGSGLFSLVASKMGAAVTSFDFDEDSVRTTESVLAHSPRDDWRVMRGSILDRSFISTLGTFDVVYAWGVLHHTGDMWAALDNAAALVRPTGTLVVSLYRKTPLCAVWRAEKRLYAGALPSLQTTIRTLYKAAFVAALAVRGRNPITYARDYKRNRGMEWSADVHDWLGGYP
jgi:2-polyprenyl-3-methyl-5-hydroxy-6-metoxy-1,4-benzoquinol methylase